MAKVYACRNPIEAELFIGLHAQLEGTLPAGATWLTTIEGKNGGEVRTRLSEESIDGLSVKVKNEIISQFDAVKKDKVKVKYISQ